MTRYTSSAETSYRDGERWQDHALCLRYEPELWFPYSYGPKHGDQVARAKAICRRCPVALSCLDAALAVPYAQDYGIAGATTPRERRKLRKARQE